MRTSILLPLCTAALAAAVHQPKNPQIVLQDPQANAVEPDEFLIELAPGETRWIKEDEKWELRRVRYISRWSSTIATAVVVQLSPPKL